MGSGPGVAQGDPGVRDRRPRRRPDRHQGSPVRESSHRPPAQRCDSARGFSGLPTRAAVRSRLPGLSSIPGPPQNVTRTLGPTASRSKGVCSCLAGFLLQAHPAQELWGCWGEVVPHLWPSKVAFPEKMRAALGRFHLNSNLIGIYL